MRLSTCAHAGRASSRRPPIPTPEVQEKHVNRSTILSISLFSAVMIAISSSAPFPSNAQQIPRKFKHGPTVDIADVPLNRTMPDFTWERHERHFFPALLGLHVPGARAIRTKYFAIYYAEAENTARRIAEIADDTFEKISRHYPGSIERYAPVHVVVSDIDILGNASSFYLGNLISFGSTPLNWDSRGTHDWVRDVFTHELTHHITLKASHNSMPFVFGLLGSSRSNQNPDFGFFLPIYHSAMPNWYAEGIAQFEAEKYGGDLWDTHRDMILRMAALEDDLLSYTDMNVFGKDGFKSEQVYNQGYAFLNYLADTYGPDSVRAMSRDRPIVNFKSAVKKGTGISAPRLYDEWTAHLDRKYGALADSIRASGEREGELLSDRGDVEHFPTYSPDGTKMAFISNEGSDYAIMEMLVMDLATRKLTKVARSRKYGKYVNLPFSWTPDGNSLVYSKSVGGNWDIFIYDLTTRKERRVTVGLRGRDPAVSPNGTEIAFVGNRDGTSNLGIVNIDGTNIRYLTNNNNGTQYYTPRWTEDGSRLLFSIFRGEDRDIAVINANATPRPKKTDTKKTGKEALAERIAERKKTETEVDSAQAEADSLALAEAARADSMVAFPDSLAYANNAGFEVIINTRADERDAVWLPGGGIVYASDRTGIFNIYALDLATGRQEQLTSVIGGAFSPSVSPDGDEILYSGYHAANYNIYRIRKSGPAAAAPADSLVRDYSSIYKGKKIGDLFNTGRYAPRLASIGVVPILVLGPTFIGNRFGLDQLSAGAEAAWGDLLGSDNIYAGFTIGKNLKKGVDLNSNFSAFYTKGLPAVHTEDRTYAPRFFIGASQQTINSQIDRGIVDSRRDTTSGTLQIVIDDTLRLVPGVTSFTNLSLTQEDKYKNLFSDFVVGVEASIGRRQVLSMTWGHRRYRESTHTKQVILDSTRLVQNREGVITDITDQIPGLGVDEVVFDDFLYRDLSFFKSNDVTVGWRYFNFLPAKDMFVNPSRGRAITLRYRRINASVTDSLFRSQLNQDGVAAPTYLSDPTKLGINEYVFSWNEFIGLPGRATLALQGFLAYKDKPIKDAQANTSSAEGVFYYPLRYYLGGLGTLRGYPYFSTSGGKALLARASLTFPIFKHAAKELPPFHFDKIYGTLFVETGATGNFESLRALLDSDDKFKRSAFLTDWGFELRMQMFTHYRIPLYGYFQIAFPTRDTIQGREIDKNRIYFGLTI